MWQKTKPLKLGKYSLWNVVNNIQKEEKDFMKIWTSPNLQNKTIVFIWGDFNAKTGSGWTKYPETVGKFGNGEINKGDNYLKHQRQN